MARTNDGPRRVEQFCPRCQVRYTHNDPLDAYEFCLDCGTRLTAPAPIEEVAA